MSADDKQALRCRNGPAIRRSSADHDERMEGLRDFTKRKCWISKGLFDGARNIHYARLYAQQIHPNDVCKCARPGDGDSENDEP